jgi:transcription elongation factor SPT6
MADNALELDEEDTTDDHPSKSVLKLMQDVDAEEKLNELHLDDFADNLRELRQVEKRFALKMIKDEIVDQGKDRRADFVLPDPWTVLTMLSGESESSLKAGLLVAAFVTQVRTNTVFLRLDSGVEGNIDLPYIADYPPASCAQVVKPQTTVQALILSVDPVNFLTQLSIRPMDLANNQEQLERQVIPDPRYDYDQLAADTAAQYKKKQMTVDRTKRQIDHPYFYNMNSAQAEQHLTNQQRGDVVIRPSSKGIDHLAVTWKVDDGLYQHLDVVEIDKPNPQALGRLLRVGGKYNYMDLDELIVNHVKATARMTEQLMTHDKFHGKTLDELRRWLSFRLSFVCILA